VADSRPVALLGVLLAATLLVSCSDDPPAGRGDPESTSELPSGSSTGSATEAPTSEATLPPDDDQLEADDPALDIAVSKPVEDSVYPNRGDPGVDALHYDLDLAWTPDTRTLEGRATIVVRSTGDDDHLQLDLSRSLEVSSVSVDGEDVEFAHQRKDLVVKTAVAAAERYVLVVEYSGTPRPIPAPTTRTDFSTNGWTITGEGEVWTMQEPHGAFTWYPVNDQPADKALYDFTIIVPSPWTGIANGELTGESEEGGLTTTTWHLAEPAASYLVTIAIGDYIHSSNTSSSGVEISYWVPRDQPRLATTLESAAEALDWLEARLGPYPFDTLGFVLVDSFSGMETQTMVTLGITDYTTSTPVLLHEMAHHWYGNEVTPSDWRDMWMNEGMVMYLQGMWEAEQAGIPVAELMDEWATFERGMRAESGPPGAYDPAEFGEGNVYYGPALMWHELRDQLGDDEFFAMIREWPATHPNSNATRKQYLAWIEDYTGEELTSFFEAWLLSETTPPRE
jgi:aminopeptidase N